MGFLNIVLSPLEVVFEPIISIGKAIVALINILLEFIKIMPKLVSLFEMFTDPAKVIKDAMYGLKVGFIMLFDATLGSLFKSLKKPFEKNEKEEKQKIKKKCISDTIIKYLILVLCPPLVIFMEKGVKAFFEIVIAGFLTYFYYFPGLIYSFLYIS